MSDDRIRGASPNPPEFPSAPVIPVSMLNRMARETLESTFALGWISGEISNLMQAASGHVYFSLKDDSAQVRCVMFRNRAALLGWRLENGQRVEVRALVTLYEARGEFQLNVESARRAGVGNRYEQFLRLKEKLEREGLFAPESKRPLPALPRRIGIVTSPQAAALRDVLTTLARRAPYVSVVIYPTLVQGDGAAAQIAEAVRIAGERRDGEVLIVCRGGGSVEDLWAFNDEALARAIRACPLPVITGIGHETDTSIADFVADRRAATPTAAAELVAPQRSDLLARLDGLHDALRRRFEARLDRQAQYLDGLAARLRHPSQRLAEQTRHLEGLRLRLQGALDQAAGRRRQRLGTLARRLLLARPALGDAQRRVDALEPRLSGALHDKLRRSHTDLARLAAGLELLNPEAVLARGYGIATDDAGRILRDSRSLEPTARIAVCLHSGRLEATVTKLEHAPRPATEQ